MLKRILIKLSLILIVVCVTTVINTKSQTPIDSANGSARTALVGNGEKLTTARDCDDALKVANQRLAKTLDALEQAETVINTLQKELSTRKNLDAVNESLITKKDKIIEGQQKLIEVYEKQKGLTVSFLFGLIKIRKN